MRKNTYVSREHHAYGWISAICRHASRDTRRAAAAIILILATCFLITGMAVAVSAEGADEGETTAAVQEYTPAPEPVQASVPAETAATPETYEPAETSAPEPAPASTAVDAAAGGGAGDAPAVAQEDVHKETGAAEDGGTETTAGPAVEGDAEDSTGLEEDLDAEPDKNSGDTEAEDLPGTAGQDTAGTEKASDVDKKEPALTEEEKPDAGNAGEIPGGTQAKPSTAAEDAGDVEGDDSNIILTPADPGDGMDSTEPEMPEPDDPVAEPVPDTPEPEEPGTQEESSTDPAGLADPVTVTGTDDASPVIIADTDDAGTAGDASHGDGGGTAPGTQEEEPVILEEDIPENGSLAGTPGTSTQSNGAVPGVTGSGSVPQAAGTYTPYAYTYTAGTYTGSYPLQNSYATWYAGLTDYQRLLIGMKQAGKKYAVASTVLDIRDRKSADGTVTGRLPKGGLCFILADADLDWVYVESGECRGFVPASSLVTGTAAEKTVNEQGEGNMSLAVALVPPSQNSAFRYALVTTATVPQQPSTGTEESTGIAVSRQALVNYAMQFMGRPYLWGGDDLLNGTDCSGFTKGVYGRFGITLPRASYEQCYTGSRIDAADALPGDLVFYAQDGSVYHVLIYIGDGKGISAVDAEHGIAVTDIDYSKACWACRIITDEAQGSSTQASDLTELGRKAYQGDERAQQEIVEALATATENEWQVYGLSRSVLIAQAIQDSSWLSFANEAEGGIQPSDNNILRMNGDLQDGRWASPWTGETADRVILQQTNGEIAYNTITMRTYADMEACMDDYAAFKTGLHPELKGETDVNAVISGTLRGYASNPDYQSSILDIIERFGLTQYDEQEAGQDPAAATAWTDVTTGRAEATQYSQEQLELIWAIVAQEDDVSYEGALAVITTAMNRADRDYGGYGGDALSQLTAEGQFCYSPSVSDPIYYQRRLGGNVPEFVKQAVSDCLGKGVRNHSFLNFRSSNRTGNYVNIGSNWYF